MNTDTERRVCVYCGEDIIDLPHYTIKDEPRVLVGKFRKGGELIVYHRGSIFCIDCAKKCFGIEEAEGESDESQEIKPR